MVTTIGKYVLLLLCLNNLYATQVILRATSMDGDPLKIAGIGQPFLLNVQISDFSGGSIAPVTIKGAEQFQLRSSGYQMRIINGKSELSYTFRLRIDQSGTYTLGPAEFNEIESNTITLSVAENQQLQETNSEKKKQDSSFVRLLCDKKSVVIGQKVPCLLRYYYSPQTVQFQQLIAPDYDQAQFLIKNHEGPFHGQETIHGTQYQYLEWRWQIYPRQEGNVVIPAYGVDFIPREDRTLLFSFFSSQAKRIYSNSVSIQVNPLPGNRSADAIGSFDSFTASINPTIAKVGEGLVYTLCLSGDADLEALNLQLSNMPDSCKWYESKSYIEENKNNAKFQIKSFEYIIQPTIPGNHEIPRQVFTYFDIESHTYKKLTTNPLMVHAMAVTHQKIDVHDNSLQESIQTDSDIKNDIVSHVSDSWFNKRYSLPFSWFLFLIVSAFLIWLLYHFKEKFKVLLFRFSNSQQNIFKNARVSLEKAHSTHNYAAIYPIIMTVIAHKAGCNSADLTSQKIAQLLLEGGATEETMYEWHHFFNDISEHVFYKQKHPSAGDELFQQAFMWLNTLEKIL